MKPSQRNEQRNRKLEAVESVVQLAVAIFAFWQLRSRNARPPATTTLNLTAAPALDQYPTDGGRRAASTGAGAAKATKETRTAGAPEAEEADLRQQSYPKALLQIAISAGKEWVAHRAASKGAALALYTLFSLAPMLVLVVALAGLFFGAETVRQLLVEQMTGLMGPQGGEAIKTILAGTQQETSATLAGIVSIALVLVGATTAFAELKDSLDELWEVPPPEGSGIWSMIRQRFLSFGLILVLVLMLMASLAVSTALAALGNMFGGTGEDAPFRIVSLVISHAVSFLIVTGLFAVIFKYLPATSIAWKDVIVGALITAALFTIGKTLIGLYVSYGDIDSAYGAAGSIVILVVWIYYSAQIFFYGSLFTHEYAFKLGSRTEKAPAEARPARPARPALA